MIRAVTAFPVLLFGLYGLGEWLREKFLGAEPLSPGRMGRALAFGVLAHGLAATLLGFLHLYRTEVLAAVTVLPFVVFSRVWWRDLMTALRSFRGMTAPTPAETVFLAVTVFVTLLRLFNALAPNVSWDATSHHYLVPSIWLKAGFLSDIPSVIYSYYPSLVEMGIGATMALGGDILSNLYGWLFSPIVVLLMIGIGARHFDSRFAGISAALLFTLFPGVGVQTSGGYVDLPLACWVLLTVDMILELKQKPGWQVLILASFSSGAALSTKHLGLLFLAGFLLVLLWVLCYEKPSKAAFRAGTGTFVFLLISVALVLPWYVRATLLTGNPFYPFGIFGLPTPSHPPFVSSSWVRPDYHRSLAGLATYWLYLVFTPSVGQALGRNYPVALIYAFPLVLLAGQLRPAERFITALAGASILLMYAFFPVETRYHLPFIAPVTLVFGLLLSKFASSPPSPAALLLFLVLGPLSISLYAGINNIPLPSVLWLAPLIFLLPVMLLKQHLRQAAIHVFLCAMAVISLGFDVRLDNEEFDRRFKVVLNLEPEDRYLIRESPRNYGAIHYINTRMDWRNMRILALETRLYRLKSDWVSWFGLKEPNVPVEPEENAGVVYRGRFTHILLGDDVALKPLLYYNIIHQGGWDLPGASIREMIEYLRAHPEEDTVRFRLEDLWTNFVGEPFTAENRHFTHVWIPNQLAKEMYPSEVLGNETWYTASRLAILENRERCSLYGFVRGFREMLISGGIRVVYTDGLTFLFQTDLPQYLRSHPDVDIRTLGIK